MPQIEIQGSLDTGVPPTRRRTLLFDIDGTLLATGGAGRLAMLAALREEFAVAEPADLLFSGRTDRHLLTGLLTRSQHEASEENVLRLRQGYARRLEAVLGTTRGAVLPGVIDLLEALASQAGVVLGVLTGNLPETGELKLKYYGLWHYFQVHFFGDQHALRTDLAKHALRQLQAEHGEYTGRQICLIGDTPLDVEAAQAIGARSLATATGAFSFAELAETGADRVAADLRETHELVEWLTGSNGL